MIGQRGRRHPLSEKKIMNYMYQLCKSLDHMHRNGIFHRDVKPENILIKKDLLKLGDFGSCRSVYSRPPYTEYISTRWYRAPECLLTDGYYSSKMDMWSAGCVFYEISRLGEKQLLAMCRKTDLPEHRMGPESASPMWRCSKEARKQQTLKQAENHPIRQGPTYPVELPKLNVSGVAKLTSYSSPSIGSVFSRCGVNGKIPKLKPLKCTVALNAPQEDLNSNMKQFHLPTIGRKGGEY
uniref:MOK protein kinase n=1 Tax=Ornithorhynchus anatinus TaxID=9258 RepID=A0A6I8P4G3_ORNAN